MLKEESKKERTTRRVNVHFPEEDYETLAEMARCRNRSISDVLRDAVALEKWYEDTKQEGGRVLAEYEDGRVREIVRP